MLGYQAMRILIHTRIIRRMCRIQPVQHFINKALRLIDKFFHSQFCFLLFELHTQNTQTSKCDGNYQQYQRNL